MGAEDPVERFWRNVKKGPSCWEWQGQRNHEGYGYLSARNKNLRAHRFAYELLVGPIPAGLVVDHLCLNKSCVRPSHLEAVTRAENTARAVKARDARTHCKRGHPLTGGNISYESKGRRCRTCKNALARVRSRKIYDLITGKRRVPALLGGWSRP